MGGAPLLRSSVVVTFKSDEECDDDNNNNDDDADADDGNDGIIGATTKRVVCAPVYFISWPDWLFEPNCFIPVFPARKGKSGQRHLYLF